MCVSVCVLAVHGIGYSLVGFCAVATRGPEETTEGLSCVSTRFKIRAQGCSFGESCHCGVGGGGGSLGPRKQRQGRSSGPIPYIRVCGSSLSVLTPQLPYRLTEESAAAPPGTQSLLDLGSLMEVQ